jgi:hypothetical protein
MYKYITMQNYYTYYNDPVVLAAKNILEEETSISEEATNLFVFDPKRPRLNYPNFLAANKGREGKPMLDGGIRQELDTAGLNGSEVKNVIYVGNSYVLYKDKTLGIVLKRVPKTFLDTMDGSIPWSFYIKYSSEYLSIPNNPGDRSMILKAFKYVDKLTWA